MGVAGEGGFFRLIGCHQERPTLLSTPFHSERSWKIVTPKRPLGLYIYRLLDQMNLDKKDKNGQQSTEFLPI